MNNPKLTYSATEFPILWEFSSGSWKYYFDRKSNINVDNETFYTALEVEFSHKPSYKECVEEIIRKFLSSSEEFDLINSAYQGDDKEYKEWLEKLSDIKTKIKADFEEV